MTISPELLDDVRTTIEQIFEDEYYVEIWMSCAHKIDLELCDKEQLLKPFQDFWERLPDSKVIHRPVFYKICNLAENYCWSDE